MSERPSVREAVRELRFESGRGPVSALWRAAPGAAAALAVAHGAGNGMRNRFLEGVADGLAGGAVSSLRFNFPFTEQGRKGSDRPPVLIETWRRALEEAAGPAGGLPVAAGGKSLGGRMASMLAAEDGDRFPASALVLFGYRVDQIELVVTRLGAHCRWRCRVKAHDLGHPRVIGPVKLLEDPLLLLGPDPDPAIRHLDHQPPAHLLHHHRHPPAFGEAAQTSHSEQGFSTTDQKKCK